jgi:hypothetical protein
MTASHTRKNASKQSRESTRPESVRSSDIGRYVLVLLLSSTSIVQCKGHRKPIIAIMIQFPHLSETCFEAHQNSMVHSPNSRSGTNGIALKHPVSFVTRISPSFHAILTGASPSICVTQIFDCFQITQGYRRRHPNNLLFRNGGWMRIGVRQHIQDGVSLTFLFNYFVSMDWVWSKPTVSFSLHKSESTLRCLKSAHRNWN